MEQVVLVDDLDGSISGVEKHTIAIDDELCDIDLTEENMNQLRLAISRFREVARPRNGSDFAPRNGAVGTVTNLPARGPAHIDKEQRDFIREWAKKHTKHQIADRGKIPEDVMDAFQRWAQSNSTTTSPEGRRELVIPEGGRALFSAART